MHLTDVEPRDPDSAAGTASILCFVASAATALFTLVAPDISPVMALTSYGIAVLMSLLAALLLTAPPQVKRVLWLTIPLTALVAICVLDFGTRDASAGAQVFMCLPVLFAASQLRPSGAVIVTVFAVTAVTVVAHSLQPPGRAISDTLFVGTTMVVTAWLLVRAGLRQDRLVAKLQQQAAIDPLTGLVTRRVLDDAARSTITSSGRDGGTALVLIDVDRFKTINDRFGHPVGDAALTHIAEVLRSRCRSDSVISRLGGDELAVLLPGCSHEVAIRRAHELLDAVAQSPLRVGTGAPIPLSISVGVAHAPLHADDLRGLYAVADEALYDAKRSGRGRVSSRVDPPGAHPVTV